jgi:hypothetical protein
MAVNVGSTLTLAHTFQSLTGANIAREYITVAALASGANTVVLPGAIVALPISLELGLCPDSVVILVASFSVVAMTPSAPLAYASGTTYAINTTVTSGGIYYVSLQDSNTGHTPASSPTWWQAGNASMVQAVINAAGTAAGGCTLIAWVGTD